MIKLKTLCQGAGLILLLLTSTIQAKAQFKVGLQASSNFSHLAYKVEHKADLGFSTGVFAEYRMRSPWSIRLGLNFEHHNTSLQNFDLKHSTRSVLDQEFQLNYLSLPLTLGYTFRLGASEHAVSLTPRIGVLARRALKSKTFVSSFALNQKVSDKPTSLEFDPFKSISGSSAQTPQNPLGGYYYQALSKNTYAIYIGLDLGLTKHWQINSSYQMGVGHQLHTSADGSKRVFLNNASLGVSYIF